METPKDKIVELLQQFGIKNKKASEIMGITENVFAQKKCATSLRHSFNEKNFVDLKMFLKTEILKVA